MVDAEYNQWFAHLKETIRKRQVKAAFTVNKELLELYWELGKSLDEKLTASGWGDKVVDQLARDLKTEFPNLKGFSRSNLFNIRKWYFFYANQTSLVQQGVGLLGEGTQAEIVQQAVGLFPDLLAVIPWGHHVQIITHCKIIEEAAFYLKQTVTNKWSRNVLIHQIESRLFERTGKALTNFEMILPAPQSDLANELLKNPYVFDFLNLSPEADERDLENALIGNFKKFFLELGTGFAFLGQQYLLKAGEKEYYTDLLFYQTRLHCYFIIELKVGDFEPEFVSKLGIYQSIVDDQLRTSNDKPTLGLLLCKKADKIIVEYTLRDMNKPIGVAEYKVLPSQYEEALPSVEALQHELSKTVEVPKRKLDEKLNTLKEMIGKIKREPLKEIRTSEVCSYLYNDVLDLIKNKLQEEMNGIIPEFHQVVINKALDGMIQQDGANWDSILTGGSAYKVGLNVQLNGFLKAGTKTFDVWRELNFNLHQNFYSIDIQDQKFEKLYHQKWTDQDVTEIVECFVEAILDDIKAHLHRITHE